MPITSQLNLGLPATPLAEDPKLNAELQVIYNALHNIAQVLNDAGIPSGGISPSPTILDVSNGGTGVGTLTGIVRADGINDFIAITSAVVGHVLKVTGANTFAFQAMGAGDVTGPASSTNDGIAQFDGITGKLLKSRASFTFDGSIMQVAADYPGGAMQTIVENTNTTVANSNAIQNVIVGSGAAGSAFTNYELIGSDEWVAGIDTADNFYRIARGGDFVTGTSAFAINPITGAITTAAGTIGTAAYITLGANVGTFLTTPSSANLAAALTDETGSGKVVFDNAPSFTTGIGIGATAAGAGGIAFPATAVAVVDPNTLDDYEEGTWTPGQGTLTVVGAFSSSGTYTKIGRLVTVSGTVAGATSVAGASGNTITGLPFPPVNGTFAGVMFNSANDTTISFQMYTDSKMYLNGAIGPSAALFFTGTYFI